MLLRTFPGGPLKGEIRPPGDKSISHRALILGSLAHGQTHLRGLLEAEDVSRTAQCLGEMGVSIRLSGAEVIVEGRGEAGLAAPRRILEAGNSGTTLRLLMGVVAAHPFQATFAGDASLSRRPMDRVALPLRQMGARVQGEGARCSPPVTVRGGDLVGIHYEMPVASAQVKSAILLAGLRAKGRTSLKEPGLSRDHTERMLQAFGASPEWGPGFAAVIGGRPLQARHLAVPGDFSSAAFFIVGAALLEGSEVEIAEVGLNPTRTGLLDVLKEMRANFEVHQSGGKDRGGEREELVGRLVVRYAGRLRGTEIGKGLIPRVIDEIPIICIAAACAEGQSVIRGAEELRVKESDRISSMAQLLKELGADVEELPDGLVIQGAKALKRARIESHGDHRVAMAAAVAGLVSEGVEVDGAECISTSYPGFAADLARLGAQVQVTA